MALNKKFLVAVMAFGVLVTFSEHYLFNSSSDINSATVKVVRTDERSGGTGVIISSNSTSSQVLTNNHVCEVVKNGGLVVTTDGTKHEVVSYKQSESHDLCLITVNTNLHASTKVASSTPQMFDAATISGHPALLPNIITKGHFSGREEIEVMTGVRPCTEAELNSDNMTLRLVCAFLHGVPIIKTYEAQVVSATIMPGSSGSAVYNADNELAGLVFACSKDLSYAHIVPYEYVYNFLNKEVPTITPKKPDYSTDMAELLNQRKASEESLVQIKSFCSEPKNKEQLHMCDILSRSLF